MKSVLAVAALTVVLTAGALAQTVSARTPECMARYNSTICACIFSKYPPHTISRRKRDGIVASCVNRLKATLTPTKLRAHNRRYN